MPSNLLLLLPLIGGYLFNHLTHRFRYRAQALSGHRLILEAAFSGLAFLTVSRAIIVLLQQVDRLPPSLLGAPPFSYAFAILERILDAWPTITNSTPFAGTTALAVLIAPISAAVFNLVLGTIHQEWASDEFLDKPWFFRWWYRLSDASREYCLDLEIRRSGNALQRLLHEAAIRGPYDGTSVGITMSNDKIYAAFVTSSPNLSATDQYVSLLPIMSGHRDQQSREIRYDTPYDTQKFTRLASEVGVAVSIPTAEIRSIHVLDREFYSRELERLREGVEEENGSA